MPPRHHRTVDRVVSILEMASHQNRGLTLSDMCQELSAPKSSVQDLANGLVATGYLYERNGKFYLGSSAFVLTLRANRSAAFSLSHKVLEDISSQVKESVMAGISVGDSLVYIDHVGDNLALEFVARNHSRRSLCSTASGKIILASMQPREMDGFLLSALTSERESVEIFLEELPRIRSTRLAFNFGTTISSVAAVATALYDHSGVFVASICAVTERDREDELEAIGNRLRDAVQQVGMQQF